MMKRVSSRLREESSPLVIWISKCLIHTLLVGKDQLPVPLKETVRFVFGNENHRVLMALSDQNGTLMSYGTIPGATASVTRLVNAPVAASVGGRGVPVAVEL